VKPSSVLCVVCSACVLTDSCELPININKCYSNELWIFEFGVFTP
jgi:hypothetical protein